MTGKENLADFPQVRIQSCVFPLHRDKTKWFSQNLVGSWGPLKTLCSSERPEAASCNVLCSVGACCWTCCCWAPPTSLWMSSLEVSLETAQEPKIAVSLSRGKHS